MKLVEITAPEFDLAKTLDSGQVFHWERIGDGFCGTIGDRAVYVEQRGNILRVRAGETPAPAREARALPRIVANYFALNHPLAQICASFPQDETMKAASHFCRGLRIIRQPKWECLATFICSSMKQVAHIRQISQALRRRFGEARKIGLQRSIQNVHAGSAAPRAMLIDSASPTFVNIQQGTARSTCNHTVYTFPPPARLAKSSEKDLRGCALGYRTKNLLATARLVTNGDVDLEKWAALADIDLRAKLCELPGVGAKVANCVMLFAYERLRAFPIDVWIERVLRENYFPRARKLNATRLRTFTQEHFGEHGGYAQQYLFHHARMNKGVDGGRRAVGAKKNGSGPSLRPAIAGLRRGKRRVSLQNDKSAGVT
jgi:N-glycosylase/DNA lyase